MTNLLLESGLEQCAVIDDDQDDAKAISWLLEDWGFTVNRLDPGFDSKEQLVDAVANSSQLCVMDNRLMDKEFAPFNGPEPLAMLYDHQVPGVLLTYYDTIDEDVGIRQFRDRIPSVVSKKCKDSVLDGMIECFMEFKEGLPRHRVLKETLLNIVSTSDESRHGVVDMFLPSWDPEVAVRAPIEVFGGLEIRPGSSFIGQVNTSAREPGELYFKNIRPAPDPVSEDRFG